MSTMGRRNKMIEALAMYFAEKGYVPDSVEYANDPGKPISHGHLRKVLKGYARAVRMVEVNQPDLWELANGADPVFVEVPQEDSLDESDLTEIEKAMQLAAKGSTQSED